MFKLKKNLLFSWLVLSFCVLEVQAAESIGSYNNGCIKGAVPLKAGTHFQIQKWGVERNYGHPELIDYINSLVKRAKESHLPDLLIGDLGRPLGGPFGASSSHGSHQSGLDVDVSFDFAEPRKSESELRNPKDVFIVDQKNRPTANFDDARVALLYLAAQDERVERIFVAPGIKRVLCKIYEGKDRSWLRKIRPWFGHRGHMHVRLACPLDSPNCVKQAKVPAGDGCGEELMSWFLPPPPSTSTGPRKPKPKKVLPALCRDFFIKNHYKY
jgi:penicillin-insensitive murein endopeptidase